MNENPSSAEEAVELFLERRRQGEEIDPAAFASRHPGLGPELISALDALLALERVTRGPEDDLALPGRIGAFRVVREVGRGGMGVVLEAVEEPLGRRVALKVLPPELLASVSARARFRREAELAARLDHSGIATIYGAGVQDDRPWIAMRYVEGETLAHAIARARDQHQSCVRLPHTKERGREAALSVAACIARVARALHSAHEQGVVHRDVKPSNIIVAPDGSPVLLDFGLAIAEGTEGPALTRTGERAGTPAYIAPESVSGELARPDVQSDVYALGITLYECLALRRPFEAPTPVALYRAILMGAAPDLRALNRSVPRDMAVVVATAMERDRSRRYRSAAALADDLEACVAGRPIAARPVPLHGRILRWARREPRLALLASLLAVATVALALFGGNWWASRDEVRAAERVARGQALEVALADGFSALEDIDGADAAFDRALALEPGNLEALAGKALVRAGSGRRPQALALLENAPRTPGFEALRSLCRRAPVGQDAELLRSESASGLDFFLTAVSLNLEADTQPLSLQDNTRKRVVLMLDECVHRTPVARSFFQIQRALAAVEAGDERTARSAAGALLALWPDSYPAVFAAARALAGSDPAAARSILARLARLSPGDETALQNAGTLCILLGDLDAAERWLWRALDRGHHAETYDSLAIVLSRRGCFDEAGEAYRRALAADPNDERAWLNLGYMFLETGDVRSALLPLERVIELDPANPLAHRRLGKAQRLLGQLQDARAHLERSVALDVRQASAWEELARTELELGERGAALDAVSAGIELAPPFDSLRELRDELERAK